MKFKDKSKTPLHFVAQVNDAVSGVEVTMILEITVSVASFGCDSKKKEIQ